MIEESDLYYIWQSSGFEKAFQEELNLHVLYCGRFSPHQGPDFQGARFDLNGIRYAGDVEFHVRRKDWFMHNHHLDSRYDNVILHIVADGDDRPVINSQERTVKTLSFDKILKHQPFIKTDNPCLVNLQNQYEFNLFLKNLSMQRLDEQCNRIRKLHYTLSLDNCLYYLMFRAQGYVHNTKNFEILARKLPYSQIRSFKNCYNPSIEFWLGLYFGSAGFLPDQMLPGPLNEMWSKISSLLSVRSIQEYQWHLAGVRPHARPRKRLAVFAHFMHQLRGSLFDQFYSILYVRQEIRQTRKQLINILKPRISEYYKTNFNDEECNWGDSFITEIIGNIIIPVFICWSKDSKSDGFSEYLRELYFSLPAPAQYGIIQKSKLFKKTKNTALTNFFEQQAVLLLIRKYCDRGLCISCPFLHCG